MINLYTQAIKLFGDTKVNKYRFPYRAPWVQAISQAIKYATSGTLKGGMPI